MYGGQTGLHQLLLICCFLTAVIPKQTRIVEFLENIYLPVCQIIVFVISLETSLAVVLYFFSLNLL